MWRVLVLAAAASALPRRAPEAGFRPVEGARGPAPRRTRDAGFAPSRYGDTLPDGLTNLSYGGDSFHQAGDSFSQRGESFSLDGDSFGAFSHGSGSFSHGGGSFSHGGGSFSQGGEGHSTRQGSFDASSNTLGEPDKTIFVRMPDEGGPVVTRPPQAAGPPQKHYRIVIIRNPSPPEIQPIVPPKTEQKTVIYVLHQKPKVQQQVIETPVVKHPPQVLFVGYDEELSSDDLQKLAQGDHSGFTVTSQKNPGEVGSGDPQAYNN